MKPPWLLVPLLACLVGCSTRVVSLEYKVCDNAYAKDNSYPPRDPHTEYVVENPVLDIHKRTGGLVSGPCGVFFAFKRYLVCFDAEKSSYDTADMRLFEEPTLEDATYDHPIPLSFGHVQIITLGPVTKIAIDLRSKAGSFRIHDTFSVRDSTALAGRHWKYYLEYRND